MPRETDPTRNTDTNALVISEIQKLHEAKTYRPVAMGIIFNQAGDVLIVQSAKSEQPEQGEWYFPQGGIEQDEDPSACLRREIREEMGLPEEKIEEIVYLGSESLDTPNSRPDKRGFTKGKTYFTYVVKYNGDKSFILDTKELANARWVSLDQARQLMLATREEKRRMMESMLDIANLLVTGD